jgi:hypothetical protein
MVHDQKRTTRAISSMLACACAAISWASALSACTAARSGLRLRSMSILGNSSPGRWNSGR